MKILIILVAIVAIFWAWRTLSRSRQGMHTASRRVKEKNMVACVHCGLHIPQDEAVVSRQLNYCCKEHSMLGPGKH